MYGYAGDSAAATTLAPFTSPTPNADPAAAGTQAGALGQATASATGTGTQSTLSQALSSVPNLLQNLASGSNPGSNALLDLFNSSPIQYFEILAEDTLGVGVFSYGVNFAVSGVCLTVAPFISGALTPLAPGLAAAPEAAASALPDAGLADGLGSTLLGSPSSGIGTSTSAGLGAGGVSAGLDEAASVGGLSVPPSWGTASPAVRLAAKTLPMAGADALPQAETAAPGGFYGGMPPMVRWQVSSTRQKPRKAVIDPTRVEP